MFSRTLSMDLPSHSGLYCKCTQCLVMWTYSSMYFTKISCHRNHVSYIHATCPHIKACTVTHTHKHTHVHTHIQTHTRACTHTHTNILTTITTNYKHHHTVQVARHIRSVRMYNYTLRVHTEWHCAKWLLPGTNHRGNASYAWKVYRKSKLTNLQY